MGPEDQKAFLQEVELEMDFHRQTRKNITKRKDRVVLKMHTGGAVIKKKKTDKLPMAVKCHVIERCGCFAL